MRRSILDRTFGPDWPRRLFVGRPARALHFQLRRCSELFESHQSRNLINESQVATTFRSEHEPDHLTHTILIQRSIDETEPKQMPGLTLDLFARLHRHLAQLSRVNSLAVSSARRR